MGSRSISMALFLLGLVCCSGNSVDPSGDDTGDDGGGSSSSGGSSCNESGPTACNNVINAICNRYVQCCTAPGASGCFDWAMSTSSCVAEYVSLGFDCSSGSYSKQVCSSKDTSCENDIMLVACSDLSMQTANWPASCNTFWGQF